MSAEKSPQAGDGRAGQRVPAPAEPMEVKIDFFGKTQGAAPAPFETVSGKILFQVNVAGRAAWALLDNRAERSLVDARFATALKFDIGPPEGMVKTPFGVMPKRRVLNVPIAVPGQFEVCAPALAAADLRPLFGAFDREVALVFGEDYCNLLAVFVDANQGVLRFGPSGTAKISGPSVQIELLDGRPALTLSMEGTPLVAKVALGFDGTVRVSPQAWARVRPDESDPMSPVLDGKVHMTGTARVSELVLGPMRAHDMHVQIAPIETDGVDALLGLGVLRRSPFILDTGAGRLWIAPARERSDENR